MHKKWPDPQELQNNFIESISCENCLQDWMCRKNVATWLLCGEEWIVMGFIDHSTQHRILDIMQVNLRYTYTEIISTRESQQSAFFFLQRILGLVQWNLASVEQILCEGLPHDKHGLTAVTSDCLCSAQFDQTLHMMAVEFYQVTLGITRLQK